MFDMTEPGPWKAYEWLVVVGGILAFMLAWGIGANDVANAFGTSVGAGTIQLWQACIIAAVFEFAGAIALGGQVSKTVSGNITDPNSFAAVPEVFGYGMLCALAGAWFWMTVATYWEFAVSSTHAVIGAVLGFGLVYGGAGAIKWADEVDDFPFRTGFVTVVIAWFVSPFLSGLAAYIIFVTNRTLILRRENSTEAAFCALPPLVLITVFINVFFVLYKGVAPEVKWGADQAAWVSAVIAVGCAVFSVPGVLLLRRRHYRKMEEAERAAADKEMLEAAGHSEAAAGNGDADRDGAHVGGVFNRGLQREGSMAPVPAAEELPTSRNFFAKIFRRCKSHMIRALTMDIHRDVEKNAIVAAMHAGAEVFLLQTERVYRYLQTEGHGYIGCLEGTKMVFSACCVSFAHGSNDVANSIGPFAGIWYVFNNRQVSGTAPTPRWILVVGGIGIVIGLATYGYKIIKVLGVELAKMTPARGFSAELSAALVISLASVYGLPISSTHCIVGAEVGVGLAEGHLGGTNWRLFGRTACGWVLTIVVAGLFSAAFFALGVYSPSVTNLDYVQGYQGIMLDNLRSQLVTLDESNQVPDQFDTGLKSSIEGASAALDTAYSLQENGHINQYDMQELYKGVNMLFKRHYSP